MSFHILREAIDELKLLSIGKAPDHYPRDVPPAVKRKCTDLIGLSSEYVLFNHKALCDPDIGQIPFDPACLWWAESGLPNDALPSYVELFVPMFKGLTPPEDSRVYLCAKPYWPSLDLALSKVSTFRDGVGWEALHQKVRILDIYTAKSYGSNPVPAEPPVVEARVFGLNGTSAMMQWFVPDDPYKGPLVLVECPPSPDILVLAEAVRKEKEFALKKSIVESLGEPLADSMKKAVERYNNRK